MYGWSGSAQAASLAESLIDGESLEEKNTLDDLMAQVPKSTKKIAGKSLPIEKFVSRKARKFVSQGGRLILPAIELGYFFGAVSRCDP